MALCPAVTVCPVETARLKVLAAVAFLALGCQHAAAQAPLDYRDRTGDTEIRIRMSEEPIPNGEVEHSRMSDGDRHDVTIDPSGNTSDYRVQSPSRRLDYSVVREGNVLVLSGVIYGSPLSRRITINALPWYQALERSLRDWIVSGARGEPEFWIVHPWEANAYLLQASSEGEEEIPVNGRQELAVRVRVRPVGILRFFWSALYWFRPTDGRYLRYEAVRGLPGTPKTVIEYLGSD